jgi:hypothetical protein
MTVSRHALLAAATLAAVACQGYVRTENAPAPDAGATVADDAGPPAVDAFRPPPQLREPGESLELLTYPAQNARARATWGDVLTDIVQHLPVELNDDYSDPDPVAYGRLATLGIGEHLRGNYDTTGRGANAFYLLRDRAVLVDEPPVPKSSVAVFVPSPLRGSLYEAHVAGAEEHEDRPLYLFEQWVAHTNALAVTVDRLRADLAATGSPEVATSVLETTVYAVALGMTVEQLDPVWFRDFRQFRELLAFQARRAMDVYRQSATHASLTSPTHVSYLDELTHSQDAAELRSFVVRAFGTAWSREVLAFD